MGPTDAVDGRRPKEYITRTRRPRAGFNQNPRKDMKESVDEVSAAQQKQKFNKSRARIAEDRGKPKPVAGPAQQPSKQNLDSVDQAPETHQKQDASRPRAHVSEHRDNSSSATNLPLPESSQDTNDALGVSGHQKKPSAKKQGPRTLDQMFESQEAVSADELPTQPSQSEAKQASGPVSPEKRSFEDVDHISDSDSDSDSSLSSLPPSPADLGKRARPPPGTYNEPAFNYVSGDDSSFSRPSLHSDDDDIETSSSGHDLGADTGSTSDSPFAVVNCNKTMRERLRKTADTLVGDQMDGVPISRRPTGSRKTSLRDAPLPTLHKHAQMHGS